VPTAMVLFRRRPSLRLWLVGSLLIDAVAFLGMNAAQTVPTLLAWRALDGVAHLPAVTLLMAIMALGLAAGDLQQPLETEEGVLRPTCTTLLGPPRLSRPSKQLTAMSEYDRCVSAIQTRCRSSTRS